MKKPIVLIGFTKYNDGDIVKKANFIIDSMTGNLLYADAGTRLSDVEDALDAFMKAQGKKGKILNYEEEKEAARKVLNAALQTLGKYVSNKYPYNVSNWMTSGFDVQTYDGATHRPGVPKNIQPKDGEVTGSAIMIFDKEQFAEYYEGRNWKRGEEAPKGMTATSNGTKMTFDEMTAGDKWFFQIRANGSKGKSDWSPAIEWIVR